MENGEKPPIRYQDDESLVARGLGGVVVNQQAGRPVIVDRRGDPKRQKPHVKIEISENDIKVAKINK